MRNNKKQEIVKFCEENNLKYFNIRNIVQSNKTRIVISLQCTECGTRFDVTWDTLQKQKFKGLCTKCAHKKSSEYRKLTIENFVSVFNKYGYKVVTPINQIKPRGKNQSFNKTVVTIENQFGERFDVRYNNFINRIEHYIKLNETQEKDLYPERHYEKIVADFLESKKIPYKREFIIKPSNSPLKGTMRFDFCLFYKDPSKRLLIEVDERHHYVEDRVKRDKNKDYYCKTNNLPLLRLHYLDIKNNCFVEKINAFLKENGY